MKHIINLSTWERRESLDFFKDFVNPYISVTCSVNCKKAKQTAKHAGVSFFTLYLHAIMKALNAITELRYRIDRNGAVVEYDHIDALCPIKKKTGKGFVTIRIPYQDNRAEFCKVASDLIKSIDSDKVFGAEGNCIEYDVVIVSAIPSLRFTSLSCTQRHNNGNDYPLINVGGMDEGFNMPIALSVHHGLVDGEHIADFYCQVQSNPNS